MRKIIFNKKIVIRFKPYKIAKTYCPIFTKLMSNIAKYAAISAYFIELSRITKVFNHLFFCRYYENVKFIIVYFVNKAFVAKKKTYIQLIFYILINIRTMCTFEFYQFCKNLICCM